MNKPKYLYIDDENDSSVEAIRDGFNDEGFIEVEVQQPKDFRAQKNELVDKMKDYDGLILDLRLDQNMQLNIAYNAPSIAQEIRMMIAEKKSALKPYPIILCSTDERMRATYDIDQSSHDLFDYKFLKGSEPDWKKFSHKLAALAKDYKLFHGESLNLENIFGRTDLANVDPRLIERFLDTDIPAYTYVHFIIKELFHHPGPLIKERTFAARLGIDIEGSGNDWTQLREEIFNDSQYSGLFSNGWNRWWSDMIVKKFKDLTGKKLTTLNARERVKLLIESTSCKGLKVAEPIHPGCKSDNFWTTCELYKKPLDPLEGFKIYQTGDLKSWQEHKYLSFDAITSRKGESKGLRPHPSELKRIQSLKKQ